MKVSAFNLVGGCCLLAMVAGLAVQRRAIVQTRAANEALRDEAAAPVASREPTQTDSEEFGELERANRELPKLRNEVRNLRAEKREMEGLWSENERLAAQLKAAPQPKSARLSEAEGFVVKEKWTRAGFATPEATLQTFFWAVANADFATLAECAAGEARKKMEQEMQQSIASGKFQQQFEPIAKMQGFRIGERKQVSEDTVELSVQAVAGGRPLLMRLKLLNGEWKLDN